jgi:hypothetical protein
LHRQVERFGPAQHDDALALNQRRGTNPRARQESPKTQASKTLGKMTCCGVPPRDSLKREGGLYVDRQKSKPRRAAYFSKTLHTVSFLVQNPQYMTIRDVAILAWMLFALWRGYFAVLAIRTILVGRNVAMICPRTTAMGCLWVHVKDIFGAGFNWAADVTPWSILAILVVFFAEEGLNWAKGSSLKA